MEDLVLFINTRANGYAIEQCGDTLTVGELIKLLEYYDEDRKIFFRNDNGYTYGSVYLEDFSDEENEYEDYWRR